MNNTNCQIGLAICKMPFAEDFDFQVSFLYIRADHFDKPIDWNWLRTNFKGQLVYALRTDKEQGTYQGSRRERHRQLLQAAKKADLIELEGDRDLVGELLEKIPPEKRMISWHGSSKAFPELEEKLNRFSRIPAKYYRLVPAADTENQALAPLKLLKKSRRKDLIAYASGPVGLWTQILSVFLGSPFIIGKTSRSASVETAFTIRQMVQDYGLPDTYPVRSIYGIAGNPVFTSLSPRLHNNTYRELGMDALFLPFHIESFDRFWRLVGEGVIERELGIDVRGFTSVSPFKEASFEIADTKVNPHVLSSKASNILYKYAGKWYADSTDGFGVLKALNDLHTPAAGLRVAIIGCGGAGRTIASALKEEGARITLFNRTMERGKLAACLLGLPFYAYDEFTPEGFDLVINATPLGKKKRELPFDPVRLSRPAIIIDMAYSSEVTRLIRMARILRLRYVDGRDTLVYQVRKQFELMTGKEMPLELAQKLAAKNLKIPVN